MTGANEVCTNFYDRMARLPGVNQLIVKAWSHHVELPIMTSFDTTNVEAKTQQYAKLGKVSSGFRFDRSLSSAVLKIAGLIPTNNEKLLALKSKFPTLTESFTKTCTRRSQNERKNLKSLLTRVAKAVISKADMILCTTTCAVSEWVKPFTRGCDIVAVDEATSVHEIDILIGWDGSKPLMLIGDPEQLSPPIFTRKMKHVDGDFPDTPVNAFVNIIQHSFMHRLMDLCWPYIDMVEQLRMCPGQFNMTNQVHYHGRVVNGPDLKTSIFPTAIAIEEWMNTKKSTTLEPPPEDLVFPVLIDVKDSFCYVAIGGTSKANTATAYYTLSTIHEAKDKVPGLKNEDIGIVVPYSLQRSLYIKAILQMPEFDGIMVSVATSYQGWEKKSSSVIS